MSILSDIEIKQLIEAELDDEKLLINPFEEDCLTPMGYDLRVGGYYKTYKNETKPPQRINEGETITIKSGETALIDTIERVCMPRNCSIGALLVSRVSQVNRGLSHISTKIDPNWDGTLKIAVSNFSKKNIELKYKEKICCIVFFSIKNPSRKERRIPDTDSMNTAVAQEGFLIKIMKKSIPPLIVIGIPAMTLIFTKNDKFLIASVSIGVAISNIVNEWIK
jgi:deoxycytidine triphosphate deaminase